MKLIVGLGNPGSEYQGTRHNVGFQILDNLVSLEKGRWVSQKEYSYATLNWGGKLVYLLKPLLFMNNSGEALKKFTADRELSLVHLGRNGVLVVHDDLDLPLGHYKVTRKSPKI